MPLDTRPAFGASWTFALPLLVGAALNPVNSSLIATALVPIGDAFRLDGSQTAVLVAAIYVASAIAQPTAGRFAEQFGPRRVFLAGMVLVVAGGVLGAVAPSLAVLVVSRAVLGIGTSTGYPTAMLMIARNAPEQRRGSLFGALAIAAQVTVVLGLPLGGVLVGLGGWQAVFLVNVPFGLVALAAGLRWLPADPPVPRGRGWLQVVRELDAAGIVLFACALTTLMIFVMSLQHPRWWIGGLTVVLMLVLIARERRASWPFFDVRSLVANRSLSATYVRTAASMFGTYCVMYGVPQWLQQVKGLDATATGLVILPMTAVAALVSGPVSRRNLVRRPLWLSALVALAVAVALVMVDSTTGVWSIVAITTVLGVAVGLSNIGNQAALYDQADGAALATAAGLLRTSTYLGAIASSSVLGFAYGEGVTDGALHTLAYGLVGVSAVVLVITVADRSLPTRAGLPR